MTDIILTAPAGGFDVSGNNDLMLLDCSLRARGRHPEDKATECLIDFAFDEVPSILTPAKTNLKEYISGSTLTGLNLIAFDDVNQAVGVACVQVKNAAAQISYQPSTINLSEFTLEGWVNIANVAATGFLWSEYITLAGISRWFFYYTNQEFRLYTYDPSRVSDICTCDCSGGTGLSNGIWYRFQVTYDEATTTSIVTVKDAAGNIKGTGTSNTAKVMPSPGVQDHPGLHLGQKAQSANGITTSAILDEVLLDDTQLYSDVVSSFVVPSAPQPIFATGAGGDECDDSTVTLDAGLDNSTWDMSSLDVDDTDQWAATVGGDGWTIRYEASNSATPSTYSSWLTRAGFISEGNPTGRYLHLSVRCHDADGLDFYPIAWLSVLVTLASSITEPNAPAFDALTNDGDGDAVTLTITPPAAGDYDETIIFYRIFGSGDDWTAGGTYVGTQGVQGTKQITGLTNLTRYQFIIFTKYDVYFSEPSPTLSVFCTDNVSESFVRDIADFLENEGFGVYATDLFVNDEPATPNDCITVYSSGGGAPDSGSDIYRPTVMVRVRGASKKYPQTFEIAENILVALHAKTPTINGSRYIGIWATSDVMRLGRDEDNRVLFSINFRMLRTPA